MDYTQSDANVTDGVTGNRMHQSTAPITTEVSSDDMNAVNWELLELIKGAGLVPAAFNKAVPATYAQVRDAVAVLSRKQSAAIASATGSADVLIGAYAPGVPALVNGLTLYLRAAYANATITPTFTPHDGVIAAKEIVKGNDRPLVAGDIDGLGHWLELKYDGTLDKWVLNNPATFSVLAASSGASLVGFDFAPLPAAIGTIDWALKSMGSGANVLRYIPPAEWAAIFARTSTYDASTAINSALSSGELIQLPLGKFRTTSPIVIGVGMAGFEGRSTNEAYGSVIDYIGADEAIKIFDTSPSKRVTGYGVKNIAIRVNTSGANGIDFSHGSYGEFRNIWIRLLESNQAGVYGMGNTLGSSPYYNQFDNIKIFGNADNVAYPNQKGFYFVGDGAGNWSDGPNANVISNCGQITGLAHGVHIESGTGNLFSNIVMESIFEYAYRFGNAATPSPGRADENMVVNHWMEGTETCVLARFEGNASANSITNYSANSIGPVLWDNQSSSPDNFVKSKGNMYVVDFYGQNIPANATTILSPTSPAWAGLGFGGVIVPFRCIPYLMQVTAQNFAAGGLGTGIVKAYRAGVLNPALQFTIQDGANRLGGKAINRTPDVTHSYNTFDGSVNAQLEVAITTDAAWDQATSDVHVQVVFLG